MYAILCMYIEQVPGEMQRCPRCSVQEPGAQRPQAIQSLALVRDFKEGEDARTQVERG